MVEDITKRGLSASEAAAAHSVSVVIVRKWFGRYLVGGVAALADKSSRPELSSRAIDLVIVLTIIELCRKLFLQARIASYIGVSCSIVSRVL